MILWIALTVVLLAATFIALLVRLASRVDDRCLTAEWLDSLSTDNYAPMQRLLDRRDFEFLASQPGYRREIGDQLLTERRRVFAGYLNRLVGDFNQLVRLIKLSLVHSTQDRPELAQSLVKEQVRFYSQVCWIRFRLAFFPLGLEHLDTGKLVAAVNAMRDQLIPQVLQTVELG